MNNFTFQLSGFTKTLCFMAAMAWLPGAHAAPPENLLKLNCPEDVTVYAAPEKCTTFVNLEALAWNNSTPVAEYVFNPDDGFPYPIGSTIVTLAIVDVNGGIDACTFSVNVLDFNNGLMVCQNNVLIDLDENCQKQLTPDLVLVDSTFGCWDNIRISLLNEEGEDIGNLLSAEDIGKYYTFKVSNTLSGKTCQAELFVGSGNLPAAITCPEDTSIFCNVSIDPQLTGQPLFTGCFEKDILNLSYSDQNLPSACSGDGIAYVITRTWQAIDTFGNITHCNQEITGHRIELDDVVFPLDFNGSVQPAIPCDGSPIQELISPERTGVPTFHGHGSNSLACRISSAYQDLIAHPCGSQYTVQRNWTVTNLCDNSFVTYTQLIIVEDEEGISFSVPDTIFVSTSIDCTDDTYFPPIEISHQCSDFSIQIITPWGTLNTNGGYLKVAQSPGTFNVTYRVTDECENLTEKIIKVIVASNVISACPSDRTITCDVYKNELEAPLAAGNYEVLDQFGLPQLYSNCNLAFDNELEISIDECSEGTIRRTFSVTAGSQYSVCNQLISVAHLSAFVVEFPQDTLIACSTGDIEVGEPIVTGENCESIEMTFSDEIIDDTTEGCYQILRTWKVVNTCIAGANPHQQIVEAPESVLGIDLDGDGDMDDRTFRDSWTSTSQPGVEEAGAAPWDGFITYQQVIEVIDEQAPVFLNCKPPDACMTTGNCTANVLLPMPTVMECSPGVTITAQILIGAGWQNGFGPYQNMSAGTYDVRYVATDRCGNEETCATLIKIKDCQPPQAKCISQVEIQLPPSLMVEATAEDFNSGSFDNCPGNLEFSFSSNINDKTKVFDCGDLGSNSIQLWVTDPAGNQSACSSTLVVASPPSGGCNEGNISGYILTEDAKGIANVEINNTALTDNNGLYQLSGSGNVTLSPYKNANIANGVTTFDAVLLTRHVLGIQLLDSPYKIIAADVNRNNSVTTFDAVEMRKIILLIYSNSIPNNTSWRFIPANFTFPNPANPFAASFPEISSVSSYPPPPGSTDFIGFKIGDLNNTANPLNFSGAVEERDFKDLLPIRFRAELMSKGEQVSIPFYLPSTSIYGFQFALSFDTEKLRLQEVVPGFEGIDNFALHRTNEGILKTSWHTGQPFRPDKAQAAFSLVFTAMEDGFLPDWLRIDPGLLPAEAYDADMNYLQPVLVYQEDSAFRLLDPKPNPFSDKVQIRFYMPESGMGSLQIFDAAGSLVKTHSAIFEKGMNELEITGEALPDEKLFFFKIKTSFGSGEGKLLKF